VTQLVRRVFALALLLWRAMYADTHPALARCDGSSPSANNVRFKLVAFASEFGAALPSCAYDESFRGMAVR
jgi:hypothetical protein